MPLTAALTALLASVLLLATATRTLAAFPGRNGPLVEARQNTFETPDGTAFEHCIREVDSYVWPHLCRDVVRAVETSVCRQQTYARPSVSPNGRSIVFEEAGGAIAVTGHDGTGYRRLGPYSAPLISPSFAPDGRRLVTVAVRRAPQLYKPLESPTVAVTSLDGGRVRRLTPGTSPDWSVRGWIGFLRAGNLYRIRPDGTRLRRLTWRGCDGASWSPDGRRIACTRGRNVVTMAADGSDLRRVPVRLDYPLPQVAWSPDGRQLALGGELDQLAIYDFAGRFRFLYVDGTVSGAEYDLRRIGWDWGPRPR